MAKKSMNIKYKSRKRERNKYDPTMNKKDTIKSGITLLISVLLFLGLMYLGVLGMEKLGTFEEGYTAPSKETAIDYENIKGSTVFTRSEKTYYVMFDDYSSNFSYDNYISSLLKKEKTRVYKVDLSLKENSKYVSSKSNKKATRESELKINGRTLIKIVDGKIKDYIEGSTKIEEYLK